MAVPQDGARSAPRLLVLITRAEEERRLEGLLADLEIPILFQCRGKGTAPSEMLDIFGLSGTTRQLTAGLLPKERIQEAFALVRRHLSVHQRGRGIALTIPVTGLQAPVLEALGAGGQSVAGTEEHLEEAMTAMHEKTEYALIWAAVASGFSEDAVDAARAAGAKGGTVLKGRRRNSPQAGQALGLPLQDGQEFVLIVVPKEKKAAIMSAICEACGLRSPAHGVVLSLPVEDAIGLEN